MLITLAQFIVSVLFIGYLRYKYGVLTSISASTYELKGTQRALFTFFCWTLAGLNLFQGMGVFGVVTSFMLAFTGVTLNHNDPNSTGGKVHYVATLAAIGSAFIGLIFVEGLYFPALLMILSTLRFKDYKNSIWHIEVTAIFLILLAYAIR